jgi:hypothetical protein
MHLELRFEAAVRMVTGKCIHPLAIMGRRYDPSVWNSKTKAFQFYLLARFINAGSATFKSALATRWIDSAPWPRQIQESCALQPSPVP